jgi:hypothetical protein
MIDFPLSSTCFHRARYPYSLFGREFLMMWLSIITRFIPHATWTIQSIFCCHLFAFRCRTQLFDAQICVLFLLLSPQFLVCFSKHNYFDAIQIPKLTVSFRIRLPTNWLSLLEFRLHRHQLIPHYWSLIVDALPLLAVWAFVPAGELLETPVGVLLFESNHKSFDLWLGFWFKKSPLFTCQTVEF